jgi:plastocyanin
MKRQAVMISSLKTNRGKLYIQPVYLIIIYLLVTVFVLPGCNKNDSSTNPPVTQGTNEIFIQGNAFSPQNKTVAIGTTIKWINKDAITHTVTSGVPNSPDGTFDSGNVGQNGEFSFTFNQAGTFDYFCNIHHSMTGKIIVQ